MGRIRATNYRVLNELKQNGLVRINVSFDKYHSEFVQAANVVRVLKACSKLHIPSILGLVIAKDDQPGSLIDEIVSAVPNINIQTTPCLPVGEAIRNIEEKYFIRHEYDDDLPCYYEGSLVISYDGKIYPCCSQMVIESGLCIGDYKYDTLPVILKRIKNNGILYLLRNRGVGCFIEEAKKAGLKVPEIIVSPCELCAFLFKEENLSKFLPFVSKELKRYV